MTGLRFRSLHHPPSTDGATDIPVRKPVTFQADYSQTIIDLERELRHLGVADAVISTGHDKSEIGVDGWPRSGARKLTHPAVALHLSTRYDALAFTCDTHADWQSNLRAIALTLEALRAVYRHGVATNGAQYRGFATSNLVDPINDGNDGDGRRAALRVLLHEANVTLDPAEVDALLQTADGWRDIYRLAVLRAHPDTGGTHERFLRVTAAMETLRDAQQ